MITFRLKSSVLLLGLAALLGGCRSSSESTPALVPLPWTVGTLTYDVTDLQNNQNSLLALRLRRYSSATRDTSVAGSSISGDPYYESFTILENGDYRLDPCDCSKHILPIGSHQDHDQKLEVPTENNGYEAPGGAIFHSAYLGTDDQDLAGETWLCNKLIDDVTVWAANGKGPGLTDTVRIEETYWYAPKLRYFVRIDKDSITTSKTFHVSTRQLKSYSLQ